MGGKSHWFSLALFFSSQYHSGQKLPPFFSKHHKGMAKGKEEEKPPPAEPCTSPFLLAFAFGGFYTGQQLDLIKYTCWGCSTTHGTSNLVITHLPIYLNLQQHSFSPNLSAKWPGLPAPYSCNLCLFCISLDPVVPSS